MKQFGRQWQLDISNDQETLTIDRLRIAFDQRALPRGKVLSGDSRMLLNKIARNNQADWSIQDGSLIFLPKNKVLNDEAVLLSQEMGMINAPEQTDEGLELTCLLNPALQIGGLVQVQSILDYFNGEYKIVKLAHSGDGIGGDWQSKLTVVGGKFQKVEKPKKSESTKDKKRVNQNDRLHENNRDNRNRNR